MPVRWQKAEEPSRPKLGLALSGGGFRASFFHIGVLAQMAQLGLLGHVEVISTVSGGSILGALYYLYLKRLLEQKPDHAIQDSDYIELLELLEEHFLRAVQRNLRMRTFRNPLKNLKMALESYSRSDRIGELYDEHFYRPVLAPGSRDMIQMRNLKITPPDAPPDFYPRRDNAARSAKVPILLLNATTLNAGHNWRFEASTMGEPEGTTQLRADLDKNLRLARPDGYADITPHQQDIELGLAVAASACVPAIFHPLALSELYPDGERVQLVDGGVHDNQGIQGLLDEGCTCFVISDASKQMSDEPDPETWWLPALTRSQDIFQERLRDEQLLRVLQTCPCSVALMHLRKGLPVDKLWYIDSGMQPAHVPPRENVVQQTCPDFHVDPEVQALLSRIRTDLDSFTEVEAFSLMADAYQMSKKELSDVSCLQELITAAGAPAPPRWRFLQVAPWLADPTEDYKTQLRVAGMTAFKIFRLDWRVSVLTGLVLLGVLVYVYANVIPPVLQIPHISVERQSLLRAAILLVLAVVLAKLLPRLKPLLRLYRLLKRLVNSTGLFLARAVGPAAFGWLVAGIHLLIFDRLFLRHGRIQRLKPPIPKVTRG